MKAGTDQWAIDRWYVLSGNELDKAVQIVREAYEKGLINGSRSTVDAGKAMPAADLTKRELFAMAAMAGLLARGPVPDIAKIALGYADKLIAALQECKQQPEVTA